MIHPHTRRFSTWGALAFVSVIAVLAAAIAAYLSIAFMYAGHLAARSWAEDAPLYIGAMLSSAVIGPFIWWLIILCLNDPPARYGRGTAVGVISSLVAHPFTWLIAFGWSAQHGGQGLISVSPDNSSFGAILSYVLFYSWYSLIYVGWITAIVGGLAGVALGRVIIGPNPPIPSPTSLGRERSLGESSS